MQWVAKQAVQYGNLPLIIVTDRRQLDKTYPYYVFTVWISGSLESKSFLAACRFYKISKRQNLDDHNPKI